MMIGIEACSLFIEMINASFESENNVKSVAFREAVNHILATLVAKYSQESGNYSA